MQLAILTVVRNEASRWLPSVLSAWSQFADVIVALDDGSTDDTADFLRSNPFVDYYLRESDTPMWGAEAEVRQTLWQLGVASGAEWLMVLDADMVPCKDPRPLLTKPADAVSFCLYDLWMLEPPMFRMDGFWQGAANWRIWAVRNPGPGFADEWPERGIHCGHFPSNLQGQRMIHAPYDYGLLHLAYSNPTERKRKYEQYMAKAPLLSEWELAHAKSIMDKTVTLGMVPNWIQYDLKYEGGNGE